MAKTKLPNEYLEHLATIYSEGFEAGLKVGLQRSSSILSQLSNTINSLETTSMKKEVYKDFMEFMEKKNEPEEKGKVIDIQNVKKQ